MLCKISINCDYTNNVSTVLSDLVQRIKNMVYEQLKVYHRYNSETTHKKNIYYNLLVC